MDRELIFLLKTLKHKTGIEIDVYSSTFAYLYSSGEKIEFIYSGKYTDGLQDKKQNITLFRFRFKKEGYYGAIKGSSCVERNYALFICNFIENNGIADENITKKEFIKAVLRGEIAENQINRYMRKFSLPQEPCYVFYILSSGSKVKEIVEFLENFTINGFDTAFSMGQSECAFVKFMTSESEEYQSPAEFAEIFCRSLYEETGILVKVGVGGIVKTLSEIDDSFAQAEYALKLSEKFNSISPVHTYKEYTLYKVLSDLSPATLNRYYNSLVEGDTESILSDEDMLETAEEFMANNLNVSETARKLYMHRNTLTYRLDKIKRATGLDIRNFSDAEIFNICKLLRKILNK